MNQLKATYREYPPLFWRVLGISFIDQMGWAIIFPFFSLFITERFNVGMTEVGVVFFIYSVTGIFGNIVGGALADKFGRKVMIIIGLIFSAFTSLGIGLITDYNLFIVTTVVAGFFSMIGSPAHQALLTDILPEEKRNEGFGMFRIMANLTVVIGPALGTLLYPDYFIYLFIADAIISTLSAVLVLVFVPETKPEVEADENGNKEEKSLLAGLAEYGIIFKDYAFMMFMLFGILITYGYHNVSTVLPVYLRDDHGLNANIFGYMMSMNALIVVVFQLFISKRIKNYASNLILAVGSIFYAISFLMFGFVKSVPMFFFTMVILTIGEMMLSPTQQKAIGDFAPEDMRGRYMAMSTFMWVIPSSIGTLISGYIMDNSNGDYVWYLSFGLAIISIFGYWGLYQRNRRAVSQSVKSEAMMESAD